MKRILIVLVHLLLWGGAEAQQFGNEWINYDRQHWYFKVVTDGLYRIDSTVLAQSGFPVSMVDPRDIQVFGRERQVPIHVQGEADGVFNTGDYIEFHVPRNNCWKDSLVWESPDHINNPNYSLYNDTIRYFLTWDPDGVKRRVRPYTDQNVDQQPPRSWYWTEAQFSETGTYNQGKQGYQGTTSSLIGEGEGYFGFMNPVTSGTFSWTRVHQTVQPYTGTDAPNPRIRGAVASVNSASGETCNDHHLRLEVGGVAVADTIFTGVKVIRFNKELPASVLGATTTLTTSVIHDLSPCTSAMGTDYPDRCVPSWSVVRYPCTTNMGNSTRKYIDVPHVPGATFATMHINGVSGGTPTIYVLGDTVYRVVPVFNSQLWKVNVPVGNGDTKLFYGVPQTVVNVPLLVPVNGSGLFTDHAGNAVDSAFVIVTHPRLMEAATGYAQFRESSPYNPFHTQVADVEDLYMQYGGGIMRHPMAIRGFMRHMLAVSPSTPRALFLVGKSVQAPRTSGLESGKGYRADVLAAAKCLVPSFGYHPSDALFTLGLSGQPWDQTIPVGRLAANTPEEVVSYKEKVQQLEAQQPAAWMKNILHFRGGSTAQEASMFNAALESYRYVAEDTMFMGRVTKFVKNGNLDIPQTAADSVRTFIENGVTIMTFFAHAFGAAFDITISDPGAYQWNGKYPLMIGNSCYTGNIHLYDATSMSERFVLAPASGAVGFLSSVNLGLANYLQPYTADLYRSFSRDGYGKGVGDHMRHAARIQLFNASTDIPSLNNVHTLALHGDPMVVLNSPRLPDLDIQDADIRVIPATVTADLDSFDVQVVVRNIGRGTHAPFSVALERTFIGTSQSPQTVLKEMTLQHFQDTILFRLPVRLSNGAGVGLNDLAVRVDLDPDLIQEGDAGQNELNNRAHVSLQVISGDLVPVYPFDLAVVPGSSTSLKASTGDPFAPVRNYRFQIDTTDAFNSPVLEQTMFAAPGGVVEWSPSSIYALNGTDSVVYYWRTTLDSAGSGLFNWRQRSFQHIAGKQGWGQAHFQQFRPNTLSSMVYEEPQRRFGFFSGIREVSAVVRGMSYTEVQWNIDLEPQESMGCGTPPAIHVGVVDPFDFQAWLTRYQGVGMSFGNINNDGACRPRQERVFAFRQQTPAQLDSLGDMLLNDIPDGHLVVLYSYVTLMKDELQASAAWPALQAIGATNLTNGTVQDSVPYILMFWKGDPTSATEAWGEGPTSLIHLSMTAEVNTRSGRMAAPRTDPFLSWSELSWRAEAQDVADSLRVELFGQGNGALEVPLAQFHGMSGVIDDPDVLATAMGYPFARLKGAFWDPADPSPEPAQLKRWHLLGEPAPECAIDPPNGYYTYLDSVFQGEQAAAMVAVRNIGEQDMDSLLMTAWVIDQNNVRHRVHYRRNPPLPIGAVLRDTVHFSTLAFPGANALVIEANPIDTTTGVYDQRELYRGNNIATIRFRTIQDRRNPVLDVTFDGVHILDGDLVSARPEIQITLDDENEVLLMDSPADTALFKVFLTPPSGVAVPLYFRQHGQDVLHFSPATGTDNIVHILYRPVYVEDGKYKLVVRAADKSNNASADRDYTAVFEVVNKPTITEVLNYPNPFTTNTRFVFTLTGHEAPTAMRIQIMTVTGRVVREIAMNELGPIRVGRNVTEFAWDGTDQFGDRLARGVYLYRVMAQLHGQDIEYRETGAGEYFTKGFGKMYLLR